MFRINWQLEGDKRHFVEEHHPRRSRRITPEEAVEILRAEDERGSWMTNPIKKLPELLKTPGGPILLNKKWAE